MIRSSPKLAGPVKHDLRFKLQRRSAQPAVSIRAQLRKHELADFFRTATDEIKAYLEKNQAQTAGPWFATFGSEAKGDTLDVRFGISVNRPLPTNGRIEDMQLPRGEVLVYLHAGREGDIQSAYAAVASWLEQHGRTHSAVYECYLNDVTSVPAAELKTEIVVYLNPAR